jgi:hypothetical protein
MTRSFKGPKRSRRHGVCERRGSGRACGSVRAHATPAARALGATSLGALAVGALALGSGAIGALAIGSLAIRRGRIGRLQVRELSVGRLSVEELSVSGGLPAPTERAPATSAPAGLP